MTDEEVTKEGGRLLNVISALFVGVEPALMLSVLAGLVASACATYGITPHEFMLGISLPDEMDKHVERH